MTDTYVIDRAGISYLFITGTLSSKALLGIESLSGNMDVESTGGTNTTLQCAQKKQINK